MKKIISKVAAVAAAIVLLSSCAIPTMPIMAWAYADVKGPVAVTGNSGSSKVGTSQATGILGLVTTGDASIEAAAKAAGISKIHHVDYYSTTVIGVYATYTTIVYGE